MSRLAIVAHFDPRGAAAPHFLRQLDELGRVFDRVVVSSPSPLTTDAVAAISSRAELFRRSNYGHDFGSWRDVLESESWGQEFDEVLLTNDSYVGYFTPLEQIVAEMSMRPYEVWGLTKSWRHGEHVQSYFLHFTNTALHSQAFVKFWMDAAPATDRADAIARQEVGISQTLLQAGFALGSYFDPTLAERRRAVRRGVHWLRRRRREFPARFDNLEDGYFDATQRRDPRQADNLNWSSAFADSTLDAGRLPVIKFDTLRYDPYWLGSGQLLDWLEKQYPDQLGDVRAFLEDTSASYGRRRYENHGFASLRGLTRMTTGYSRRPLSGASAKGAARG